MNISNKQNNTSQIKTEQNQLIEKLNKTLEGLSCDKECMHKKKEESLYERYMDMVGTRESISNTISESEKKYYIHKHGQNAYDSMMIKRNQKQGKELVAELDQLFNKEFELSDTILDMYESLLTNVQNTVKLDKITSNENVSDKTKIDEDQGFVETSERKSYYTRQKIGIIENRYNIMYRIFYLILFIMIIFIIVHPPYKIYHILLLILFALYPVFIHFIVGGVFGFIRDVIGFFSLFF